MGASANNGNALAELESSKKSAAHVAGDIFPPVALAALSGEWRIAMKTYKVKIVCFALGVGGHAEVRARSKRRAWRIMLQEFFEKFPKALERRLSVGGSVTRA